MYYYILLYFQEKSGGKIIYRNINVLLLYRGRNYDPKNRPVIPLMLWKPYAPIYPRLVKNVAEGLTFEETKEMRNRGLNSPPLMKLSKWTMSFKKLQKTMLFYFFSLRKFEVVRDSIICLTAMFFFPCSARNGVYVNVVERVREAFKTDEVVRLDCTHVGTSDCKKIGVKLRVCPLNLTTNTQTHCILKTYTGFLSIWEHSWISFENFLRLVLSENNKYYNC